MKKHLIILPIFSILCLLSYGQEITDLNKPTIPQDYLKKSKDQKTAGFVFLGITGAIIAIAAPGNINFDALPTVAGLGLAAGITTITLFISSGKNKRKANLSLTQQKTSVALPIKFQPINSLTLKLSLGK